MKFNGCEVYRFQSDAPIKDMKDGYYHLWSVWEMGYEWWEIQWYGYNIYRVGKKLITDINNKDGSMNWSYAGLVEVRNNRIKKVKDEYV